MDNLYSKIIRAIKLDKYLYEEVEADESALSGAMLVVILSSLASGFGGIFQGGVLKGLFFQSILALIGWFFWAFLIYLIGVKLLPEANTKSDIGELLRTTGFASAPGILRLFGIIPGFYLITNFVVSIWMLIAMVIAVRQALDYTSTGRAILVCLIGWIVQVILTSLLIMIL